MGSFCGSPAASRHRSRCAPISSIAGGSDAQYAARTGLRLHHRQRRFTPSPPAASRAANRHSALASNNPEQVGRTALHLQHKNTIDVPGRPTCDVQLCGDEALPRPAVLRPAPWWCRAHNRWTAVRSTPISGGERWPGHRLSDRCVRARNSGCNTDPCHAGFRWAGWCCWRPWRTTSVSKARRLQGTPGKLAMSIKVTDLDGQQIGAGRALGRYVSEFELGDPGHRVLHGCLHGAQAGTARHHGRHAGHAQNLAPEQIAGFGPRAGVGRLGDCTIRN